MLEKTEFLHFHYFRILGRAMLPKTFFNFGDTRILQIVQEESRTIFEKYYLGTFNISAIQHFDNFGTDGDRKHPKLRLLFLKILNMGSICIQKHEMEIW